jgi:hypothetical protein
VPRAIENVEDLLPNLPEEARGPSFGKLPPIKELKELEGIKALEDL